ncbi:MAG: hypothetical protein WA624_02230 [Methylocella sp.]
MAGQNQASLVVGVERDSAMFNLATENAGYGSTVIHHARGAAPATLLSVQLPTNIAETNSNSKPLPTLHATWRLSFSILNLQEARIEQRGLIAPDTQRLGATPTADSRFGSPS